MTTPDPEAGIRAALEAGPTPGPWNCFYKHKYDEWHVSIPIEGSSMKWALFDDGIRTERPEQDAKFIAACNPAAISALLAELDRLRASAVPVPAVQQGGEVAAPVAWMRKGAPEYAGTMHNFSFQDRRHLPNWQPLYAGAPPVVQELTGEQIEKLAQEHFDQYEYVGYYELQNFVRAVLAAATTPKKD